MGLNIHATNAHGHLQSAKVAEKGEWFVHSVGMDLSL
jgi:hypothetical protein